MFAFVGKKEARNNACRTRRARTARRKERERHTERKEEERLRRSVGLWPVEKEDTRG